MKMAKKMEWKQERRSGKKEGIAEGRVEGKSEGEKNKAIEIAKNMLKENFDIETIIKVTGLTKEEVEKLWQLLKKWELCWNNTIKTEIQIKIVKFLLKNKLINVILFMNFLIYIIVFFYLKINKRSFEWMKKNHLFP